MTAIAASIWNGFRNGYARGMDHDDDEGGSESAAEAAFAAEYPDLSAILSGSTKTLVRPITLQRGRDRWEAFFTGADSVSADLKIDRARDHFRNLYPADGALLTAHAPFPPSSRARSGDGAKGGRATHLAPGETIEWLGTVRWMPFSENSLPPIGSRYVLTNRDGSGVAMGMRIGPDLFLDADFGAGEGRADILSYGKCGVWCLLPESYRLLFERELP